MKRELITSAILMALPISLAMQSDCAHWRRRRVPAADSSNPAKVIVSRMGTESSPAQTLRADKVSARNRIAIFTERTDRPVQSERRFEELMNADDSVRDTTHGDLASPDALAATKATKSPDGACKNLALFDKTVPATTDVQLDVVTPSTDPDEQNDEIIANRRFDSGESNGTTVIHADYGLNAMNRAKHFNAVAPSVGPINLIVTTPEKRADGFMALREGRAKSTSSFNSIDDVDQLLLIPKSSTEMYGLEIACINNGVFRATVSREDQRGRNLAAMIKRIAVCDGGCVVDFARCSPNILEFRRPTNVGAVVIRNTFFFAVLIEAFRNWRSFKLAEVFDETTITMIGTDQNSSTANLNFLFANLSDSTSKSLVARSTK